MLSHDTMKSHASQERPVFRQNSENTSLTFVIQQNIAAVADLPISRFFILRTCAASAFVLKEQAHTPGTRPEDVFGNRIASGSIGRKNSRTS